MIYSQIKLSIFIINLSFVSEKNYRCTRIGLGNEIWLLWPWICSKL